MDAPKPGSWIKKSTLLKQKAPKTKKAFLVQPHLTQKPMKNNPELTKLKNSLKKE